MEEILGKKILFISPEFFGIDKIIINNLEEKGAVVQWYNERSIKSSFSRALNSINPKLFYFHSNKYYEKIIDKVKGSIDLIFVIKGEMISKKTLLLFRRKFPNVELVLYLYDPIKYIKGILEKTPLYDRVISFEPNDCKKYGFEFRALFCDFEKVNKNKATSFGKHYDICFYGTMYGDRFQIVYQLKKYCDEHNLNFYSFCYLRGKFMAIYYWLKNPYLRKLGMKRISFSPKTSLEIASIIASSNIVFDANDIYQQGLTLRTLETFVSGKKMITTNNDIVNYDFYNPNNIYVVDRKNIQIPYEFLNTKYEYTEDNSIIEKYTAKGWVKDVFGKREI